MAQRFKAKTLLSNSGVFNNEVIAPNLVYNTGNQTISGNKIFDSLRIEPSGRVFSIGTGLNINSESGIVRINTNVSSSLGAGFTYALTSGMDPNIPLDIEGRGRLVHGLSLDAGSANFTSASDHFHVIFSPGPSNPGSSNGRYSTDTNTNYKSYQFSPTTRPNGNENLRDLIHLTTLEAKGAGDQTFPTSNLTELYLTTTGTTVVTPPGTGLVELAYAINSQATSQYLHATGDTVYLRVAPGVAGIVANTYNGTVVRGVTGLDPAYGSTNVYKVGIALGALGINNNFNSAQKGTSTQTDSWTLTRTTASNAFTGITRIERNSGQYLDQFNVFYTSPITGYTGESIVVDVFNRGAGTFIAPGITLTQARYDGYVSKVLSSTGLEITLSLMNYGSLGGIGRPGAFHNPPLTTGSAFISSEDLITGMQIYRGASDAGHRNYWAHNVFVGFRNVDANELNVPAGVITRVAVGGLNRVESGSSSALGFNNKAYGFNSHVYGAHQENYNRDSVRIGATTGSYINIVSGKLGVNVVSPSETIDIGTGNIIANNLVYNTGDQTINGVKTFASRPTVNGTGVFLSGESILASQISNSSSAGRILLTGAVQTQRDALSIFPSYSNYRDLVLNGPKQTSRIYTTTDNFRTYVWVPSQSQYIEASPSNLFINPVVNSDFSNLSGLTVQTSEWWQGVPTGWSGVNNTFTIYSGLGTNNYVANIAQLSTGPSGNSFRQNLGRLPITSDVKLTFTYSKISGYVFYQDDFSANNGALSGRATADGLGNWTTSDNAFQVGSDKITINSNTPLDYHAASFALPTLGATDTLSLSITIRPAGPNFMGLGFNPNPATGSFPFLTQSGYGWVYYEGLGAATPNIQIFKGPSTASQIYSATLANPALNFNAALPTTFQYTYSAAAKTLSLLASNGANSSTLLNNTDVSTIPLEAFSNFSLQFQGQTLGTDTNPAYVDNLGISGISKPSTLRAAIYNGSYNTLASNEYLETGTYTLTGNSIPANANIIVGFWAVTGNPALDNVFVENNYTNVASVEDITTYSGFAAGRYATITNLDSLSGSSVLIYGNQTISGVKTFETGVNISGHVGIGINNNDKFRLYVRKSAAGVTVNPDNGSIAVFEGSGNSHITVLASDAQTAGVVLGSPTDNFGSYLSWNHDNNELKLGTDKAGGFISLLTDDERVAVTITSGGNVGIGTISPSEKLQVVGNIQVSGTGIFNALDLNNIDNLNLSGVDITVTSGVVTLTNPVSAPNLVYNTGNQTISGVKTFASRPIVNGTGVLLSGESILNTRIGTNNIAVGDTALASALLVGANNTAVGAFALSGNISGDSNSAFGAYALASNRTGDFNTAIGTNALKANIGNCNTAVGNESLEDNIIGIYNVAVGDASLRNNRSGDFNCGFGGYALSENVNGNRNTAVGYRALDKGTSLIANTAVGEQALLACNSFNNTAVGQGSMYQLTSGNSNSALGLNAGATLISGSKNTLLGTQTDVDAQNRNNCVVIGANTISPAVDGSLAIGGTAGNAMNGLTTGTAGAGATSYLRIWLNGLEYRILIQRV
jgi:hypothetical protein